MGIHNKLLPYPADLYVRHLAIGRRGKDGG